MAIENDQIIVSKASLTFQYATFLIDMTFLLISDSKSCQKHIGKISTSTSKNQEKFRLEDGDSMRDEGLEKKHEINGKISTIVGFIKEKSRFDVDLEGENFSLKSQNLCLTEHETLP